MKHTGWILTLLACLAAADAAAGSFSVAPTRVEFDAGRRTASITLRNADPAAPLTIQATLVEWTQQGGEDVYTETRELLATPPVFTIPPGGEQVVRLALRRAQDAQAELPFRIFFQEVPPASNTVSNTLNIALRVGVPVFVLATQPDEGMYLQWQAVRTGTGELTVSAVNTGGTHVQVTGFRLVAGDATAAETTEPRYVLPRSRMSWTLKVPSGTSLSGLRVDGRSDMGEFAADVEVVTGTSTSPAVRAAR